MIIEVKTGRFTPNRFWVTYSKRAPGAQFARIFASFVLPDFFAVR